MDGSILFRLGTFSRLAETVLAAIFEEVNGFIA